MQKQQALYSGKAKTIYVTDDSDRYIMHFRDDISAFNAEKLGKLKNKGAVNNQFNAFIMQKIADAGVVTHFERMLNDNESLVKKLEMIPVECVVRNIAAGSLCKRLGIEEGKTLTSPLFEFFLKDDALGDPLITEDHIRAFQWASDTEITQMRTLTLKVNEILQRLFAEAGLLLVDYKLEFGRYHGDVVLGDEFTPDGCRVWDAKTREKLDKDRFRQDLGDVVESYQMLAHRLGIPVHYEAEPSS